MSLICDKPVYQYTNERGLTSTCGLKIYKLPYRTIVVFIHPNPPSDNFSVTSHIEEFTNQVVVEFRLRLDNLVVIDYHPGIKSQIPNAYETTISRLKFKYNSNEGVHSPDWITINKDELVNLTNTQPSDWKPYEQ